MSSDGTAYITGDASSQDFPLVQPLQVYNPGVSPFVAAVDPTGSRLLYSSYFGATDGSNDPSFIGDGAAIAVDGAGRAYVTGWTSVKDFRIANAVQPALRGDRNAFVSRIAFKPRLMAPSTWTPGQDLPLHGMDFTPNSLYQIFTDSCPNNACQDGLSSQTGTFDRLCDTSNTPPGTTLHFWATGPTSGTRTDDVSVASQ